jgi:hypothetical protein
MGVAAALPYPRGSLRRCPDACVHAARRTVNSDRGRATAAALPYLRERRAIKPRDHRSACLGLSKSTAFCYPGLAPRAAALAVG